MSKLLLLFLLIFAISLNSWGDEGIIYHVQLEGIIGAVTSRYLVKAIEKAEEDGVTALIIELDTPGGLDPAMRDIVKAELASEVPIVVYVSPSGGRAASAGAFITLAAHVAAMSPGTNIGAAHPVTIGEKVSEEMKEKVTNDAVAYIKSIADRRERNADWAEDAVRKSSSITEKEALELGVTDFIAEDLKELLHKLDGRKVKLPSGERVLETEGVRVETFPMSFREKFLTRISDPNIAYILFILGFYGLLFEITHPGAILPGVFGALCLVLAFFAFQTLPINYAGVALIVLGIAFFILEVFTPTYGPLAVAGIISMTLGSTMLIEADIPFLKISWGVIIPAVGTTAAFFVFGLAMAIRAMKRKPTTGQKGLIGTIGVARTKVKDEGTVFVHGELWKAISDEPIRKGEKVTVLDVDGLVLKVEKVS